jgi:Ca2+-binding RTX toxin-like protein
MLVLIDGYFTNATGNAQNNTLTGNSLDNVLDGAGGVDSMIGGAGNDTYVTDGGDTISDSSGTDTVNASVTYALGSNLENLTLLGNAAIDATGNALANVLIGNSANNTLTGGAGADVMSGGAGNDTYFVDNVGDTVYEAAGEGIDLVQSSVAFTLTDEVENLTLTASVSGTGNNADNVLTGNTGANTLYGNGGNDTLNGAGGSDTMYGGVGDDVYFVDATGDNTNENADEGMDTVNSSVTKTLAANIELLFLTGTNAINGTGNALSNLLRGNSMANTLAGGGGFDILEGGAGNDSLSNATGTALFNGGADADTMTGAAGNDMFIGGTGNDTITTGAGADVIAFNLGDGLDSIAVSTGTDNTVSIGGGALYADLLFTKSGNNLILQVGASNQMTFVDYYANTSNRSVANLQMVIEGTSDYDSGSSDVTRDNRIETFDFAALVADFDAARAVDPNLTSWALSNTLLSRHLAGSDSAAIGADLAYRYNRFGNLADISFVPGVGLLSAPEFGSSPQPLLPLAGLQDTSARLQ